MQNSKENKAALIHDNADKKPNITEKMLSSVCKFSTEYTSLTSQNALSSAYKEIEKLKKELAERDTSLLTANHERNKNYILTENFKSALCALGHTNYSREEYLSDTPIIEKSQTQWSMKDKIKQNPYVQKIQSQKASIGQEIKQISFDKVPAIKPTTVSVAVQLHLYYTDLIPEFFSYLNKFPFPFDLYISCREGEDLAAIGFWFKKLRYVNNLIIRPTKNRGRDIAPVYVLFAEELKNHDYFLHIHTKKSLYSGKEQKEWRKYMLDSLLADEKSIIKTLTLLESDKKIGLVFPENPLGFMSKHWLGNSDSGRALLTKLNIPFDDTLIDYPTGSFFWARTKALKKLFDLQLTYESFDEEKGQTDGTLAHTIERAITPIIESEGFCCAIIDINDKLYRFGKSYKACEPMFSNNKEDVLKLLMDYPIITFDIFDTLITRKLYCPDDIFNLIEIKIRKEFGIICDFLKLRKKAEALAWKKYEAKTSIDEIYEELPALLEISEEIAQKIKGIEEAYELLLCCPRKDILWIFNRLKEAGKTIILISDMYLKSETISDMLKKCGYDGWDGMWLSCEKGLRKDNFTMWNQFFGEYDKKQCIHVGDNMRSDIQIPMDMGANTYFILSGSLAFRLSSLYEKIAPKYKGSVSDSILLGSFINELICNSPFCFSGNKNELSPLDIESAAAAQFGPLMFSFVAWLSANTDSEEKLLFLAREGFLLEKLYKAYCEGAGIRSLPSCYFLSSRRAASVAAMRNENDLKEIVSQYYKGTLKNMLKSRLGYEGKISDLLGDIYVDNALHTNMIVELLAPLYDELFEKASFERKAYKEYAKSLMTGAKKFSVVDLGYSGTIQYFLSKMLKSPIGGYYLATNENVKPETLPDCKVLSLYQKNDVLDESSEITERIPALLLEGLTQAPYGQLKKFEMKNGVPEPVFDEKISYTPVLEKIQNKVINYVREMAKTLAAIVPGLIPSKNLAKAIYTACCGQSSFAKTTNVFSITDDYCSNGTFNFNGKKFVLSPNDQGLYGTEIDDENENENPEY